MATTAKKPVKIIHDCDPGHDDAVAILMAAVHPMIDLKAVTVVAGNQTLEKTVRNALNVCSASKRCADIPIAAGMSRPMVREQVIAGDIHGESGLDGPVFGEPELGLDTRHAVDLIIDLLLDSDDPITLVPTGPLTNIAMAIRKEPEIVEKIERIVLMGGAYQHGNVTPSAEFNIYADPEAADSVFNAPGLKRRMFGLNLCRQVLLERRHVEQVQAWPGARAAWLAGHLDAYQRIRSADGQVPMPLYDPVVAAWLWQPERFTFQSARVDVELHGRFTRGMTVCDFRVSEARPANAEVAMGADGPAVVEQVLQAVQQALQRI